MGEKENMQTDYQTLWNKCLAVIKDIVPKAAFDTWFVPIVPLSYEDKKFTIQVPSQFFYEYLEEKYVNVLKVTLYRVIGQGTILNYRIMVDKTTGGTVDYPAENASTAVKKVTPKDANKAPNPFMTTAPQDLDPQLNPKYNFDNYFRVRAISWFVRRVRLLPRIRERLRLTRCLFLVRQEWVKLTYAMRSEPVSGSCIRKKSVICIFAFVPGTVYRCLSVRIRLMTS